MTTKLFSLSCEDQPNMLSRILQHFSRPGYKLHTVAQSRTDISDILLISLEVVIPGVMVDPMVKKLHRIVGVLDVTVSFGALLGTAIFRLLPSSFQPDLCGMLNSFQARILAVQEDGHLLVHQLGKDKEIQQLYDKLDGPALVGFCKSPIAISQPLNWAEVKTNESVLKGIEVVL